MKRTLTVVLDISRNLEKATTEFIQFFRERKEKSGESIHIRDGTVKITVVYSDENAESDFLLKSFENYPIIEYSDQPFEGIAEKKEEVSDICEKSEVDDGKDAEISRSKMYKYRPRNRNSEETGSNIPQSRRLVLGIAGEKNVTVNGNEEIGESEAEEVHEGDNHSVEDSATGIEGEGAEKLEEVLNPESKVDKSEDDGEKPDCNDGCNITNDTDCNDGFAKKSAHEKKKMKTEASKVVLDPLYEKASTFNEFIEEIAVLLEIGSSKKKSSVKKKYVSTFCYIIDKMAETGVNWSKLVEEGVINTCEKIEIPQEVTNALKKLGVASYVRSADFLKVAITYRELYPKTQSVTNDDITGKNDSTSCFYNISISQVVGETISDKIKSTLNLMGVTEECRYYYKILNVAQKAIECQELIMHTADFDEAIMATAGYTLEEALEIRLEFSKIVNTWLMENNLSDSEIPLVTLLIEMQNFLT